MNMVARPEIRPDRKEDAGKMSVLGVFRNVGPYGLPVAALFAAIILLWAAEPRVSYNAPDLNITLYFIFSLLMPLLIIFLVSRSFFVTGELGLLMLGCGVVIWSCAGVPALVLAKSDPNITFTIYNLCLWMSALCHLVGASVSLRPRPGIRTTGAWLAVAYIGALCCVGLIIYSALAGWTPAFFIRGLGGTLLRQWVLGSAAVMFALSAALLKAPGRSPSALLNWYSLALLLIAAGIVGFMLQSSRVNDLLTWASRSALFLSGAYMLIAAIASFRESHTRMYNELLDLAADGIVVHEFITETTLGYFTEVNQAICTMLGYTQKEMCKLTPMEIMIPEDTRRVPQEIEILLRDKVLRHTKTLLAKDGRHIPAEISTRLYETQGRPMVLSIVRDITERRQFEEAIRRSERIERERAEELAVLFESVPLPVFIARDPDCLHLTGNRLADEILRIPHGGELSLSGPEKTRPSHFRPFKDGRELRLDELPAQRAARGEHVKEFEFSLVFDDGMVRHVLGYGTPLLDDKACPRGAVAVLVDITERKRAEAALSENAATLAETNRELEDFNYSVSNDLRVPLRAIAGFSQMLLKKQGDGFDEETQRRFRVITENVQTINRLIDDLMAYSRLGRQTVARRSLDIEELVREIRQELLAANPGREMTLKIGKMPAAWGDQTLIRQVYVSLLENAVKFTRGRNPAVIEAGCVAGNEGTVYYVRDNGIGFDMKFHDKLFGVFQRLHIDAEYEGTGIGLAIVHRILNRHGGRLWAEGKVDEGACFYFILPEKPSPT